MAIDLDTLKTLERIEKLLSDSMGSAKSDTIERRRVNVAGQKKGSQPELDDLNRSVFRASKNVDKLGAAADKTADSLRRARGDIVSLRTGIRSATGATAAALSNLNLAVDNVVNSMALGDGLSEDKRKETANGFTALGNAAAIARLQLGMLSKSASTLTSALEKAAGVVLKDVVPADEKRTISTDEVTDATKKQTEATEENTKKQTKSGNFFSGMLSRFGVDLKSTGNTSEWLRGQFSTLGTQLSDALINVTRDIYALQARGIQAGDSLFGLYGNAIKAGMSLEEYTGMLQDNSAAVVRSNSMDDFNASLRRSTKSLAEIGVFGPAANQLAASIRTSSVQLGVPIAEMDNVAQSQIATFKELRKSTMMTSDGFKELVQTISNNQSAQEDLLGLAPAERAARQRQLLEIGSLGHRLGLTQQASAQLTEALINQRKATAEQRFKAAGFIRQAGAMVGMDNRQTEELATLRRKKRRSPEEEARFLELSGILESRLQEMMNSGNIQAEFLAEKMGELLGSTPQGEIQQLAGQAKLQTDSGGIANADIGKDTTQVQQDIGQLLTTVSGFMKNPLADAMVTFGSMLAQTVLQSSLLAIIARNTSKVPSVGVPGIGAKINGVAGSIKSLGVDTFKKTVETIKAVGPTARKSFISLFAATNNYAAGVAELAKQTKSGALVSVAKDIGGLAKSIAGGGISAALNGLKGVLGGAAKLFVKGGPFAFLFGAVEELFTGEMAAALNLGDGLGGRLIGVVTSAFNSLFTGFTRIIDDGVNWVMEGLGFSFRLNLTRFVDQATLDVVTGLKVLGSFFSQGWNWFKAVLNDGIVSLLESLPFVSKDAPWVKAARSNAEEARKNLEAEEQYRMDLMGEYGKKREELWEGDTTTLRSIGEKQVKAQKEAADKTGALIKTTADNVIYGTENLATAAQRSVSQQVAMPQPTKQTSVVPPEVNKTQVEATEKRAEDAAKAKEALGGMGSSEEVILVLKQQVQILQQMLAYWTNQDDLTESLLKATSRPTMISNEKLYAASLRGRV